MGSIVCNSLYFWVPLDWEILPAYGALNPTYALILLLTGVWVGAHLFGGSARYGAAPTRSTPPLWPLWLPVAYLFAMALLFYGSPRMRLPAEPLLAIFAGGGVVRLAERLGTRRTAWAVAAVTLLLLVAAGAAESLRAILRGVLTAVGIW